MGMMDYVRSSYNLGEHFTNTRCQTKDIEDGIGGTMTQYWISPDGVLYWIDYSHTADFVELKEGDEGYSDKGFLNFIWVPNGIRGKVRVHSLTKYIEIYPEQWDGQWEDWPRCRIHFKYGRLVDHEDITGR
jgi:hypothetical protein